MEEWKSACRAVAPARHLCSPRQEPVSFGQQAQAHRDPLLGRLLHFKVKKIRLALEPLTV